MTKKKLLVLPFAVILFVVIIFAAAIFNNLLPKKDIEITEPRVYEQCELMPGSMVDTTQDPAVCTTVSGTRFVKGLASLAPTSTPPAATPHFTQTGSSFCGGIAGMTCPKGFVCQMLETYPDAGGSCVDPLTDPVIQTSFKGAAIKSPVTLKGTVPPGWMFEGSFPVKLVDDKGTVLAQTTAKEVTPGTWQGGKEVPFSVTLSFKTQATQGKIILSKDNPSGLAENEKNLEVPVTF